MSLSNEELEAKLLELTELVNTLVEHISIIAKDTIDRPYHLASTSTERSWEILASLKKLD